MAVFRKRAARAGLPSHRAFGRKDHVHSFSPPGSGSSRPLPADPRVARARFPEVVDDRLGCLEVARGHLLRCRFAYPFRSQAATSR